MKRFLRFIWVLFIGMVCSGFLPFSLYFSGWIFEALKNSIRTKGSEGKNFESNPLFFREEDPKGVKRGWRIFPLLNCFWKGLTNGAVSLLWTSPFACLWIFAWYAGWDNSFNKGYEQFWVGPLSGWLGILIAIPFLTYLPVAQIRYGICGEIRAFFDFSINFRIIFSQGGKVLFLMGFFSLLGIPTLFLKSAPLFLNNQNEAFYAGLSAIQVQSHLKNFYFKCSFLVVPFIIFLRSGALKIYCSGMKKGLSDGWVSKEKLLGCEGEIFNTENLVSQTNEKPSLPHFLGKFLVGTPLVLFWGFFILLINFFTIAQIFISEFLVYHPIQGFFFQPLFHFPWFNYVP